MLKDVEWIGSSYRDLMATDENVKDSIGYALERRKPADEDRGRRVLPRYLQEEVQNGDRDAATGP